MAVDPNYYNKLKAAWNGATQPPSGVTGSGLLGGDSTQAKIDKVNAWTITGVVPTTFMVAGADLLNCVNYPEFKALTAPQQQNLLMMCAVVGQLVGGSANTTHMAAGMILDYFPVAGPTIANLTALAKASQALWWQASNGGALSGPVSTNDTTVAGLI